MKMNIEIIGFQEDLAVYFTELNLAWLNKYFVVEPIDNEILSDPKKFIINKGGFIFFATVEGKIAGTFALIKIDNDMYELSKMAVDAAFQGNKIGNRILEFCIETTFSLGLMVAPWQIGIVVIVAVLLFAPQLIRPAGRILGRLAGRELRRRVGLPVKALRVNDITESVSSAMLQPINQTTDNEYQTTISLPEPEAPKTSIGLRVAVFFGFASLFCVILWAMLHQR